MTESTRDGQSLPSSTHDGPPALSTPGAIYQAFSWLVLTLGLIAFSQALSFGRWNPFSSVEDNFNAHAWLLGGCGLALFLSGFALRGLNERLTALERRHASQRDGAP